MKTPILIGLIASLTGAQSAPPRKGIPAIAKVANGVVVSIIMSDKDGRPIAQGSGFLISRDGRVVTNYHVVKEGNSAVIKLPDGAFFVVDGILAFDKNRDVAVIKAHGENFRTVILGDSDRVQVGEEVVAIGNPLSLESTVSNGIVSGIRTIEEKGGKFLQITAPISPGSSGGPLFNMAGEVVGITTSGLRGGENLNFAIPINDAKSLLLPKLSRVSNLPDETKATKTQSTDGDSTDQKPTLKETLDWMTDFLKLRGTVRHSDLLLVTTQISSVNGCSMTEHWWSLTWTSGTPMDSTFNLGDLDPTRVGIQHESTFYTQYGEYDVAFQTRNDSFKIHQHGKFLCPTCPEGQRVTYDETAAYGLFAFSSQENAERFAKALRHTITHASGQARRY